MICTQYGRHFPTISRTSESAKLNSETSKNPRQVELDGLGEGPVDLDPSDWPVRSAHRIGQSSMTGLPGASGTHLDRHPSIGSHVSGSENL